MLSAINSKIIDKQRFSMPSLEEDIKTASNWIVAAFASDNYKLDYSITSFITIDLFIKKETKNRQPIPGGKLSRNAGSVIFALGSYVGESIIKNVPGASWITDDTDPKGEVNVAIKFPDNSMIWPVQRVIKRIQNGPEDSIYVYGHELTKNIINEPFNKIIWN